MSKIPEFKVSACRLQKTTPDRFSPELAELQRMAFAARSSQSAMPEQVF